MDTVCNWQQVTRSTFRFVRGPVTETIKFFLLLERDDMQLFSYTFISLKVCFFQLSGFFHIISKILDHKIYIYITFFKVYLFAKMKMKQHNKSEGKNQKRELSEQSHYILKNTKLESKGKIN